MQHSNEVMIHCAAEYLGYIRALSYRVEMLKDMVVRNSALLEPSAIQYGDNITGGTHESIIEDKIAEIKELIAEFTTELSEYVEQMRIGKQVLFGLSSSQDARAMSLHYLRGESWAEVCRKMSYSYDGMMSLRRRALLEVYHLMPEQWRRDPIPNAM